MAMSRGERFRLKRELVDELGDWDAWAPRDVEILLNEFGLDPFDDNMNLSPASAIVTMNDTDLTELYSVVMNVEVAAVEDDVEAADDRRSNWKPGYLRLFVSHSAAHKEFVGKVANELAIVGIHGFVAHDTMEYSKPWQAQIEQALRTMQAFVAIVHPEINDSPWCNQEIGWALGRRVPRYAVRLGANPVGFMGADQWPASGQDPKAVAAQIKGWIMSSPEFSDSILDRLVSALRDAGNFELAGSIARQIAALGSLTSEQFDRLDEAYLANDQVSGGFLPRKALRALYDANRRPWPPTPAPKPPPDGLDEPPF